MNDENGTLTNVILRTLFAGLYLWLFSFMFKVWRVVLRCICKYGEWGWRYSDGKFCRIILVYFVDVGPKEKANSVVFVRKRHLCSVSSHDGPILLHSFVFC